MQWSPDSAPPSGLRRGRKFAPPSLRWDFIFLTQRPSKPSRELRTRAKTTSDFGAHSPSPRSSPIRWERENRPPSVGVSHRFGNGEGLVWLFPLPSDGRGQERVRVRGVLLEIRVLSSSCFCTNSLFVP